MRLRARGILPLPDRGDAMRLFIAISLLLSAASAVAAPEDVTLVIPTVEPAPVRTVTVDDIAARRIGDSLALSPDGRRYAVFLRQADAAANRYRSGWFVGQISGGPLVHVGDGGEIRYNRRAGGQIVGELESPIARWSPDGKSIVYVRRAEGAKQLWLGSTDGAPPRQLTHADGDVLDFTWGSDGDLIYSVTAPRSALRAADEARQRQGWRYDQDIAHILDLMKPERSVPPPRAFASRTLSLADGRDRPATAAEQLVLAPGKRTGHFAAAALPPIKSATGALAWIDFAGGITTLKVLDTPDAPGATPRACTLDGCRERVERIWWNATGDKVYFMHRTSVGLTSFRVSAWLPGRGAVETVATITDGNPRSCALGANDRLLCVDETKTRPDHIAALDLRTGKRIELADLNPEFRNIRLGRVERIEWDTPDFAWNSPGTKLEKLYPKRAFGYIIYPPDFDPRRRYPVMIEPYSAAGFNASVGGEHPLQAYAASGMIVLNTHFPRAETEGLASIGNDYMRYAFDGDLGFPHTAMYMGSTLRALDQLIARGFVDPARIGIGGVSNGTSIPLQMLIEQDRLAAVSIGGPGWGQEEYYSGTAFAYAARNIAFGDPDKWKQKPEGKGLDFWKRIDPAENIDKIEAPILMHIAAGELDGRIIRLTRELRDAGRPYDAYVFDRETHIKWQPAHLSAIQHRNLDWFRFWLQDAEDPDPAKAAQYARWRELRDLHCANPRAVRRCDDGRASRPAPR